MAGYLPASHNVDGGHPVCIRDMYKKKAREAGIHRPHVLIDTYKPKENAVNIIVWLARNYINDALRVSVDPEHPMRIPSDACVSKFRRLLDLEGPEWFAVR